MTFKEWAYSSYPNPSIDGQWGFLHITTLIASIVIIVTLSILFRNKNEKQRKIVLYTIIGIILFFELARRCINFCKTSEFTLEHILYITLPRPWCAISTWSFILLLFVKKQWLYNFTSISSLLCAIIFFAYPSVGYNNRFILFENLYSITAHMLLLIGSIILITLRFTNFDYKHIWKELIYFVFIYLYAIIEIFVLKIESDPLMFMPNNDVQAVLSMPYSEYLIVYAIFIAVFINMFYLIQNKNKVLRMLNLKE